jgi:hypothetical protein
VIVLETPQATPVFGQHLGGRLGDEILVLQFGGHPSDLLLLFFPLFRQSV